MQKKYIIDTNVLLESEDVIPKLRNGGENKVFISSTVMSELDGLKSNPKKLELVNKAVAGLRENIDHITICENRKTPTFTIFNPDDRIMWDALSIQNGIIVSNDEIFRIKAQKRGLQAEPYKESQAHMSEAQEYEGFITLEDSKDKLKAIENAFYWDAGNVWQYKSSGSHPVILNNHNPWNIKPRSVHQELMCELIMDENIDLITVQSDAGYGKTFIALACAFELAFFEKRYHKVYFTKKTEETEEKLGLLPGEVHQKINPHYEYIEDLILKLNENRKLSRVLVDTTDISRGYDPSRFKVQPYSYIRGKNIENAVVILDETQNVSRQGIRSMLTRMGENVKVIMLGDVRQIDNPYCNRFNNALNWTVKMLKDSKNFGHITLKNSKSRGPICDLVLKRGL